jgi:chemotaxis protein MotB
MARKHEHEDHVNHEAWAIPYGDLVTLLLAFFVVMYAVSSVNEGKYRVLSDSLNAAFRGTPRTMEPVAIGEQVAKARMDDTLAGINPGQAIKFEDKEAARKKAAADEALQTQLRNMTDDLQNAMQLLIDQDMIRVQRAPSWVEVQIKTDILFPSGSAEIQPAAVDVLERLAAILAERPYPDPSRAHDSRPIKTVQLRQLGIVGGPRLAHRPPVRTARDHLEPYGGGRHGREPAARRERHGRRAQSQSTCRPRDPGCAA